MVKHAYKIQDFKKESRALIFKCNEIIQEYTDAGYVMTLRQLYYQLVSRDVVPNTERSYKRVGGIISDARLAGLVDWDALEDRGREPVIWGDWTSAKNFMKDHAPQFRLPRWEGQDNYVELWVEKNALAGVLQPIAARFHVTMMVNRGYSSQSAMYSSARRFIRRHRERTCHLLYLGDHDPSGEDMVRDVDDRLTMFGARVNVKKLALTMEQIEEHQPPPNPAKMSDSRAAKYVDEHGDSSWEVDALPPNVLDTIITKAIENLVDRPTMNAIISRETAIRQKLQDYADSL